MSRSIKILDVPKTFQFSFFFTPVCVYFQKISMARNAIFFYSSAEFSNCVTLGQNTPRKMVVFLMKKNIFYLSNSQVYGVLRRVIRSV